MGITKIEAAQRQLDAAIRMFFAEDDWIAIHTLLAAGGRILRDLSEQRRTSTWNLFNHTVIPEKRKEFFKILNYAADFFKHADQDPDAILVVNPRVNEHMGYLNCLFFFDLQKIWTTEMRVFYGLVHVCMPAIFR
jgi:hypothetical protein